MTGAGRAPKVIAVFSDGTGNSAAKLFKTNVWRLYQSMDLGPQAAGRRRQIAFYDDGVGTSTFRPLALLGGALGVGLRRNVLELYSFICRNYCKDDEIYAFGFSRGAFTIRVLVGLVTNQGLVPYTNEEELARNARDAYREYRRRYRGGLFAPPLRRLRDWAVRLRRRWGGQTVYDRRRNIDVRVRFVGVWDTVAAYGSPFAELTRAIDKWLWPMSMPDYELSGEVAAARHALALDDERDTFHPLLWDEVVEREKGRDPDRIRQVWFAGMHSDVGGGYPDDGMSQVPLLWMMREAEAHGLRLREGASEAVRNSLSGSAPMHDSRRGLGGYYRYQPRKLSARLEEPDPTARIMRSPDARGRLDAVDVHESVFERIQGDVDGYAPIVLPAAYRIVRRDGSTAPPFERDPADRYEKQQRLWDLVWWRRLNYFLILALSFLLLLTPWLSPASACVGPLCILSPVISAAGAVLPGFLEDWVDGLARSPNAAVLLALAIVLLLRRSGSLQTRLRDGMRAVWVEALSAPGSAVVGAPSAPARWTLFDGAIHRIRTSSLYQRALWRLKWFVAPHLLGLALSGAVLVLAAGAVLFVTGRVDAAYEEYVRRDCSPRLDPQPPAAQAAFDTAHPCWPAPGAVVEGERYRVTLTVTEPWRDDVIPTDPRGFDNDRMPWPARALAPLFRRSLDAPWFQAAVKIVPGSDAGMNLFEKALDRLSLVEHGFNRVETLELRRDDGCDCPVYVADFVAPRSGRAFLFVNDAVVLRGWRWLLGPRLEEGNGRASFYANNSGAAEVRIEPLRQPPGAPHAAAARPGAG